MKWWKQFRMLQGGSSSSKGRRAKMHVNHSLIHSLNCNIACQSAVMNAGARLIIFNVDRRELITPLVYVSSTGFVSQIASSLLATRRSSSFPEILSSIVLLPFHPPDWLHGLQLFFVFLGHASFNFGTARRITWLLVSFFLVHI